MKKKSKVAKRQQEMKQAMQTGNLEKVAKKQNKLAQAELKQTQRE